MGAHLDDVFWVEFELCYGRYDRKAARAMADKATHGSEVSRWEWLEAYEAAVVKLTKEESV